jgi:outer membrane protein TolC
MRRMLPMLILFAAFLDFAEEPAGGLSQGALSPGGLPDSIPAANSRDSLPSPVFRGPSSADAVYLRDSLKIYGLGKNGPFSDGSPILEMRLEDVVQELLVNNPLVVSARLEWLASNRKAMAAWGSFEPDLVGGYKESNLQSYASRYLEHKREYNVGVEGKVFTGANYNVGMSLLDIEHRVVPNEQSQAFSGLSFTQPLLKGAWFGAQVAEIRIARIEMNTAYHNYRARLMNIVSDVESAYWNLAFAQMKYHFASESVDIAWKLVGDSKARLATGKMSEVDLVGAQAGLAFRLANQADSQRELLEAVTQLKILLSSERIRENDHIHAASELYVTGPELEAQPGDDSADANLSSLQPDLLVKHYQLDKERVLLSVEKDRYLPQVNLKGSYGLTGTGTTGAMALQKYDETARVSWSGEIQLRAPIFLGIESRNLVAAEKFKIRSSEKELKAQKYELASSFRLIRQRIAALRDRILNAQNVVAFRKRLLDIELKRLDAGKSNYRQIYEIEEDLAKAKQWELESNVSYRESAALSAKVSGSLLRDLGLETFREGRPILIDKLTSPE